MFGPKSTGRTWRKKDRIAALFIFISMMGGSLALAQLPTATILGEVTDATGAVVPDAILTARNTDTGQTRSTVSAGDGSYRFSALPVGNYEIRAEHPGFRSEVRSGLTLAVSEEAVVNFTLEVGAIEQTVAVTGEVPLVNTTSGSLGGLVDQQRVADLPLNGRNYIDLTLLQTGIVQHKNQSNVVGSLSGTLFSSNGAPLRSNNYLLDGASLVTIHGASSASSSNSTLGVEGIREYRVITNSFSAEYGMTMGSQMLIVSKGGTNNFHGSAFEFLRNDALDARNFFDRKTALNTRRLPPFRRNNFGGSFGGPVKKDRTFFFGVYEELRERLGVTTVTNVIGASCHGAAGATITNTACPQLGRTPSATIAPQIAPLLALFPNPNLPNNQFTFPFTQPTNERYGQVRVDHSFSANDTLFGRETIDDANISQTLAYPQFKTVGESRGQFTTLSENHVFSPILLNTFRFSLSRSNIEFDAPSGIMGPQFSFVPAQELGIINVGGVASLGPPFQLPVHFKQNIFTWSDDLFYTRGRHSFKFGALINRFQQYMLARQWSKGSASFADLASFFQAQPTSYQASTPGSTLDRTYHYTTLGFYTQDDLRLTSNFVLNLGLRYELNTVPNEIHGISSALRDMQRDAKTTVGPLFLNPSLHNISPRLGFAWDVKGNGRTAVRGGFGWLYDVGNVGSALVIGITGQPPFSSLSTLLNPLNMTVPLFFPPEASGKTLRLIDYLLRQPHVLQYNLTVERELPWNMTLTLAYGGSRGLNLMQQKEGNPTVPLGIPQNGTCVPRPAGQSFDINKPSCWLGLGRDPRMNPNWSTITFLTAPANSWYNSLQFGLTKRLTQGLQFQSSYTWSKLIDETQGILGTENSASNSVGSDPTHRTVDRGLASFDISQNWRFNAIYRFPELASSRKVAAKVLNGWWMSGILSLQSGYPFTPALQSNRSLSGVGGGGVGGGTTGIDRPDLVPGRNNGNIILGGPDRYFDPNAFTIPAAGFLGTAGRNILRGPGLANLDFSLVKDTALRFLRESGKLEFRAEFFNILNRANFATPGQAGGNTAAIVYAARANAESPLPTAGRITSTAGTSRQVQFALKILF